MAAYEAVGEFSEDGDAIAGAIWAEADAILGEAVDDLGPDRPAGPAAASEAPRARSRCWSAARSGRWRGGQVGTVMAVLRAAQDAERELIVHVAETRPSLVGRARDGLGAGAGRDSAHDRHGRRGGLAARGGPGRVVLVGAERIAANGDVAADAGTYPLAVLAARHGVPFIVCAPLVAVDFDAADGRAMPVEQGPATDVTRVGTTSLAHPDAAVLNPVTDVTPADLVAALVTEEGAIRAPYDRSILGAWHARTVRHGVPRTGLPLSMRPAAPRPGSDRGDRTRPRAQRPRRRPPPDGDRAIERRREDLVARPIADRALLRGFLERDRLFAAYAICDLEDREFSRTRWGAAWSGDDLVAVVLEYGGLSPQPLFVLGEPEGIERILADLIQPAVGVRRGAAATSSAPSRRMYRVDAGPPMVRMWVDRATFRPRPARVHRLLPVEIGELNRLYQLGLRLVAARRARSARASTTAIRVNGRLVAAAGTHVISPTRAARRRRQRDDPRRLPWPRIRDRRHRGRHRGAAAHLRPGRPQRPLRQPARARRPTGASATRSTSGSRSG